MSTLSGHAEPGYVDGPRGIARFSNPVNVAYGPDGMLYVADFDNGKIRMVDPEDGHTSTIIAKQGFSRPFGMAFASDGTLYVSTDRNPTSGQQTLMTGTIWRVDIDARTATPVAVGIGRPRGLAMLPNGKLAIADYAHHVIQIVDLASGVVTPLAGGWDAKGMVDGIGGAAKFSTPYGIVFKDGKLIVAEYDNHRLRVVGLDGSVSTLAGAAEGFADGAMASAKFNQPQGLAIASNGDIFATDLKNFRVRRITGSAVDTIAGSGDGGFLDHDDRLQAQVYGLEGITVSPNGATVFVADGTRGENVPYHRIRSIKMN